MADVKFIQISTEELRQLIREEVRVCLNESNLGQAKEEKRNILNLKEAATYTGLSEDTLYGKVANRSIPHYKPGKKILFYREELDIWLSSKKRAIKIN
jgi:excisionase family DNA binding protein